MAFLAVVSLVGRLVVLFSCFMVVPLAFAHFGDDAARDAFAVSTLAGFVGGLAATIATRRVRRELQPRDGFILVGLTWMVLPAFGAVPLVLAVPTIDVSDAYFEAMSAFTATGATAIQGLDALPLSVNVWRCLMMWIGGLGIIVLAVAILPLLGVGGSQLFKTEMTGPLKDAKLTPRIADSARAVWGIYGLLSAACFCAYRIAGMGWADAFMHMNTTVSLGGFSSHDASFAYWDSPAIEAVALFFMAVSGVSLLLYFAAWRTSSPRPVVCSTEARAYFSVLILGSIVVAVYLTGFGTYADFGQSLRHAAFNVVSVATTTGYSTQDYALWPLFTPLSMLLLGCFATCAGSTGGGIKMIRLLLLVKQARREMVRIVHPNVVNPVVVGHAAVPDRVMQSVIAFMMVYGATIVGFTLVLVFTGLDAVAAFSAVVACVNNIGPGLGEVGPIGHYGVLDEFQIWMLTAAMLLGRLELLAVVVLFTPAFWRR